MADVIITLKIMPESPEIDMAALTEKVKEKITVFAGKGDIKAEEEPVAFGLKALKLTFVADEDKGTTDDLEADISQFKEVASVECIDVRRAIG